MKINLPDINEITSRIIQVEASFDGKMQNIKRWVKEHIAKIQENRELIEHRSDKNDIKILVSILRDLLVRGITGERGNRVFDEIRRSIQTKEDLTEDNYRNIMAAANYRWGVEAGAEVVSGATRYFREEIRWNWRQYFQQAEENKETNFQDDALLNIRNVKFKVRNLALSNFNPHYAAFDRHVTRIVTRIGLLNYGYDLLTEDQTEMGTDPSDPKNNQFLHKLFIRLSNLTDGLYTPVDLDRIFWHFGKMLCGVRRKCHSCPINDSCLTGKHISAMMT